MRFSPAAIALSMAFATVSSVSLGQLADTQIKPQSVQYTQAAVAAQSSGNIDGAVDLYETALAVDPRNRAAYIGLAQIARSQNLPGKAIRLYKEALLVEPNDLDALAGQGEALVQRGALEKAKLNLARIKSLCPNGCVQTAQLDRAIAAKQGGTVLSAQAVTPKPQIGYDQSVTTRP